MTTTTLQKECSHNNEWCDPSSPMHMCDDCWGEHKVPPGPDDDALSDISTLEACTCPGNHVPTQEMDHDWECELWSNPAWRDGLLVWDEHQQTLTPTDKYYDQRATEAFAALAPELEEVDAEDIEYEYEVPYCCSCTPWGEPDPGDLNHAKHCLLWEFEDWKECECLWDHDAWSFIYEEKHPSPTFGEYVVGRTDLECACPSQKKFPSTCLTCDLRWSATENRWIPLKPMTKVSSSSTPSTMYGKWTGSTYSTGVWYKCRHYEKPVIFPSGVQVLASSSFTRKDSDPTPDLGVYFDSVWDPNHLSILLPWRDYGLPKPPMMVVYGALKDAYDTAKSGFVVELGCIGGHGRTGTALACLAILDGTDAALASNWVKKNYCEEAIEGGDQEWFVLAFGAHHRGDPTPPRPFRVAYSSAKKREIHAPEVAAAIVDTYASKRPIGMPDVCPACAHETDKMQLLGYMCWNPRCELYHIKAESPAGEAKKKTWWKNP